MTAINVIPTSEARGKLIRPPKRKRRLLPRLRPERPALARVQKRPERTNRQRPIRQGRRHDRNGRRNRQTSGRDRGKERTTWRRDSYGVPELTCARIRRFARFSDGSEHATFSRPVSLGRLGGVVAGGAGGRAGRGGRRGDAGRLHD